MHLFVKTWKIIFKSWLEIEISFFMLFYIEKAFLSYETEEKFIQGIFSNDVTTLFLVLMDILFVTYYNFLDTKTGEIVNKSTIFFSKTLQLYLIIFSTEGKRSQIISIDRKLSTSAMELLLFVNACWRKKKNSKLQKPISLSIQLQHNNSRHKPPTCCTFQKRLPSILF